MIITISFFDQCSYFIQGDDLLARRIATLTKEKPACIDLPSVPIEDSTTDKSSDTENSDALDEVEENSNTSFQKSITEVISSPEFSGGDDPEYKNCGFLETKTPAMDIIEPSGLSSDTETSSDSSETNSGSEHNGEGQGFIGRITKKEETHPFKAPVEDEILKKAKVYSLSIGKEVYVSYWDLGGDELYHATHHMHLGPDAVYILVFDVRKMNEEETRKSKLGTYFHLEMH